ncbi:MAG: hypothetical protein ABUL62_07375 [Myxococcales bacterium]
MSHSLRSLAEFTLLLALAPACGGSSTNNPSSGGSGGGSNAGTAGTAQGGQSAGGSNAAGTPGTGGASGFAGGPIDIGAQQTSNQLDVLFVIDNSSSMAGKQKVLSSSLPGFLTQLSALSEDIHFGVITTSLGAHGGNNVCQPAIDPHNDDQAQLVPSKRDGVPSYMGSGFLAFDAKGATGVSDLTQLGADLAATIMAAGEDGCGYEAPLEAMYRFLVDPEPPVSVEMVQQVSTPTGINDALLKQRNAFLRPDSSVAIVILSDENDCSIMDTGIGWFMTASARMPLSTSSCATNPNDPCCRSCAQVESSPPTGCTAVKDDSVCKNVQPGQSFATTDALHDSLNLRCFDQQRRFGFELLYPVGRYSNALSNPKILNRAGTLVDNPLFAARDGKGPRSASQITVSLIVGAPWQDLATPASLSSSKLEYLDGPGLESAGRWPILIGDHTKNQPPSDPFMVESSEPRSGMNPLTQIAISPANSTNPTANPINGHEQNVPNLDDLQYACTFPLGTPITCLAGEVCECAPDKSGQLSEVILANSPLCQPPTGGEAAATQYYGKGYPSTRELELARVMGTRAVAGSICTKAAATDPSEMGYAAALTALSARLAVTSK